MLHPRAQGFESGLRLFQGGVELLLVCRIESAQIDGSNCFEEGGLVHRDVCRQAGDEESGGDEFLALIFGVRAGSGEINLHGRAAEAFFVHGGEQLDGDQHAVAGFRVIEENDGFKVVAESDAAPVEVDDFGHGPIRFSTELEPDPGAGEVVSGKRLRNFDPLAIPDGFRRAVGRRFYCRPGGIVERGTFAVGNVALMVAPLPRWEIAELAEARDYLGGVRRSY